MRIMIDLDGCVDNYVDAFRDCVSEQRGWSLEFGREEMGPAESWTFYKQPGWNMTTPEFLDAMRYATKYQNLSGRTLPYEGATDALWELYNAGHTLVAVSSRIYGPDTVAWAYHQTQAWLKSYGCPEMWVVLTSGELKSAICKKYELTIAIEDSPDNFKDLDDAGIACYLMSRPWNDHIISDRRVYSWAEFVKAIG